jgi:hypothetical protein
LYKITNNKIEYNIISLKSITYNSDIVTNILAQKLKKRRSKHIKNILSVLSKAYLPKTNIIQERSLVNRQQSINYFFNKYKDLKIVSNLNNLSLHKLLSNIYSSSLISNYDNTSSNIHNRIFNSIKYKNLSGIRIEVKGRLTKRYRADRSIYSFR